MVESNTDQQIGYILRSYPRLSQTFILNEILALERLGISIQIFAVTDPKEPIVQPDIQHVQARVHYLEQPGSPLWEIVMEQLAALVLFGLRYLAAMLFILLRPGIDQGYTMSSRWICFRQAVAMARMLRRQKSETGRTVCHLHAHFAHDPTLIAQIVSRLTGIPYSFTAHARDLYQVKPGVLVERVRGATSVVTCCHTNVDYLSKLIPAEREKISLIYHGVNLNRFQPARAAVPVTGARGDHPPLILSVGRLIDKKGFFDLLAALKIIRDADVAFRCEIYGDGPLEPRMREYLREHNLEEQVHLAGACTQQQLVNILQQAAVFALTPVVMEDGDRDGIPNVLVEAMAVGLPVISTNVAGIPELVLDQCNGLLVKPRDEAGIAAGLIDLLCSAEKRAQYGAAARRWVTEQFDVNQAALKLRELYARETFVAQAETTPEQGVTFT